MVVKVIWGEMWDALLNCYIRDYLALSFLLALWVSCMFRGFSDDPMFFAAAIPAAMAWAFLLGWNAADEARVLDEKRMREMSE